MVQEVLENAQKGYDDRLVTEEMHENVPLTPATQQNIGQDNLVQREEVTTRKNTTGKTQPQRT